MEVDMQPMKTNKTVAQCKRCQPYRYTQTYYIKEPRCIQCMVKHLTASCTKSKVAKIILTIKGIVAKEIQAIRNKITNTINNNANQPNGK